MLTILILLTVLNKSAGESNAEAEDEIKSLNELKNLPVGDSGSIVSENSSAVGEQPDIFDRYLNSHVIRIKSPFDQSKFYDFELKHLIQEDSVEVPDGSHPPQSPLLPAGLQISKKPHLTHETAHPNSSQGRKKRREGLMRFLIPIFMAIKMKLHSIAVLMAFIAGIAIKGFVAGATGLLLSKLIGLKLLLQKRDEEEKDEENHDEHDEEAEKPIVVYLNSDQKWSRNGYEKGTSLKERYYPYAQNWDKYENLRRQKWANSPYWKHQTWT